MVMSLIESLTRIKNAVYGREVREAIHDGVFRANQISDGADAKADATQIRQDAVEDFNNQVIQEMTDKDVISAPEIIQARGDKPTLGARLDDTTAQLAHYALNVKSFGALGDNTRNDTISFVDAIEYAIINGYSRLYVPDGTYLIEGTGHADGKGMIRLPSNFTLEMSEGATLKTIPATSSKYTVLMVKDATNVTIKGGHIVGDRNEHEGTSGEWGHGIQVVSSEKVTIKNVNIKDFWGDGIDISDSELGVEYTNKDIKILNNTIDNCRRQGISITGGVNVEISGNKITNINGTAPQRAIDVESNYRGKDKDYTRYININNNYFENNAGGDILITSADDTNIKGNTMVYTNESLTGATSIVITWQRDNHIISDNIIRCGNIAEVGIRLSGTNNSVITNNLIVEPRTIGIRVNSSNIPAHSEEIVVSSNISISKNNIVGDRDQPYNAYIKGISFHGENSTISDNIISGFSGDAIATYDGDGFSSYLDITNNHISNIYQKAINIDGTSNLNITNNNIVNIDNYGIHGSESVSSIKIEGNTFKNNTVRSIHLQGSISIRHYKVLVISNYIENSNGRISLTWGVGSKFANNTIINVGESGANELISIESTENGAVLNNQFVDEYSRTLTNIINARGTNNIVSLNDLRLTESTGLKIVGGTASNNFSVDE